VNDASAALCAELKRRGFIACITDRYVASDIENPGRTKTIWLDLTLGLDVLSKALGSQWRYGARRALREGVVVRTTHAMADVSAFFLLCNTLSATKGFSLPGSEALMQELIHSSSANGGVEMLLYVGEVGGVIAGGALVTRCGPSLHYLWGASDRHFSKYRVSEAVQWQVIQDGVAAGMTRYDLEGIDPAGNPGVYEFKRKMGGEEVFLQGMEVTPLSWVGRIAVGMGRRLGRLG
jgi:lipid II:glycine glycyltransferase (peptidoglycan interpeptide bridge formation enzyme)